MWGLFVGCKTSRCLFTEFILLYHLLPDVIYLSDYKLTSNPTIADSLHLKFYSRCRSSWMHHPKIDQSAFHGSQFDWEQNVPWKLYTAWMHKFTLIPRHLSHPTHQHKELFTKKGFRFNQQRFTFLCLTNYPSLYFFHGNLYLFYAISTLNTYRNSVYLFWSRNFLPRTFYSFCQIF